MNDKSLLIRQARIIDPASKFHNKVVDVMIRDGKIAQISPSIKGKADHILEGKDLHIAPGFFDIGTQGGEPGLEHREDWESLSAAAKAGGYTSLALFPNTSPPADSKSGISYVLQQNNRYGVRFYPIGALSKGIHGEQMAELFDMHRHGAVAFSDGRHSVHNGSLLLRALEYIRSFDGWILNRPEDGPLRGAGQMHEGSMSTALGLPGIPSVAETTALKRDIDLLKYSGSKLIAHGLSTHESVQLIAEAKKEGLNIRATVPVLNLIFDAQQLLHFDANYKVMPPLRASYDRDALQQAIKDGTIDLIVSNHEPLDIESKEKEFPYTEFGAVTLESCFALLNTHLKSILKLPGIIRLLSVAPREVLGLAVPLIEKNEVADLVVFDPKETVERPKGKGFSKGINDPVAGHVLKGAIKATVLGQHIWIPAKSAGLVPE